MGYSLPRKTVRFAVPVFSHQYEAAMALVRESFLKHAIDEGQKPMSPGEGILYFWVDEESVQTSWGRPPMIKAFNSDFVLVDYTDIPSIPLLFAVKL